MSSERTDAIKAELEAIRKRHGGRLTKRDVVLEAQRNKKSVLHSMFDWNIKNAAMKHWLDRAGEVITKYVTIQVVHRSTTISAPYYIKDPAVRTNEPGFTAITSKELDRAAAEQVMLAELDRCESSINRARSIAGVLDKSHPGIADQLQQMLEEIIDLRRKFKSAA